MENSSQVQGQSSGKDSNKIYFLIVVIIALVATNTYLYFKDKKSNDRIVTLSDEKTSMQTEIDKIEAELDQAASSNVKITKEMQEGQVVARQKIAELREELKKGKITQQQLASAQVDIKQLRDFVTKYTADIEELRAKNAVLTNQRDSLQTTVGTVSAKASELEKQNQGLNSTNEELNTKVKIASAIKASSISVTPLRVRSSGKETDVSRANTTKKLRINFTVVDNSLADKGMHDIYIRIIDPSGNLITSNNNNTFSGDDEELQYTYKTAIEYANDGKLYQIDWANPGNFTKGNYTVVLYADGHTMGKRSLALK